SKEINSFNMHSGDAKFCVPLFILTCNMNLKFISLIFLIISVNCFSQDDVEVILHENVINKVLRAVGNFSDTSSYSILFFKGTYKWTVIDPKIELKANGKAEFKCDVQVEAG